MIIWELTHGKISHGRSACIYVDWLIESTNLEKELSPIEMEIRKYWKQSLLPNQARSNELMNEFDQQKCVRSHLELGSLLKPLTIVMIQYDTKRIGSD